MQNGNAIINRTGDKIVRGLALQASSAQQYVLVSHTSAMGEIK